MFVSILLFVWRIELKDVLKSMNLTFGMTDKMWDEWEKNEQGK